MKFAKCKYDPCEKCPSIICCHKENSFQSESIKDIMKEQDSLFYFFLVKFLFPSIISS